MMKTATIDRYAIYGTMRHGLRVVYRGSCLHWWENGHSVYANGPDYGAESLEAMREHARKQGFTHCRYVGDWSKSSKPTDGKLGPSKVTPC